MRVEFHQYPTAFKNVTKLTGFKLLQIKYWNKKPILITQHSSRPLYYF